MSFVGYLYDKLSWTTGTLNGGNQRGLGGNPAKVIFLQVPGFFVYQSFSFTGLKGICVLAHT